jgi:hypothetical protein
MLKGKIVKSIIINMHIGVKTIKINEAKPIEKYLGYYHEL